jgi:hypothetical protein
MSARCHCEGARKEGGAALLLSDCGSGEEWSAVQSPAMREPNPKPRFARLGFAKSPPRSHFIAAHVLLAVLPPLVPLPQCSPREGRHLNARKHPKKIPSCSPSFL